MPSAPPTQRGQRTRLSLIDAARRVFERDGFLGARISDIAEEAGVAHGTFYTYFTTKEELFHVVASSVLSTTAAVVRPIEYGSGDEAVRGIARATRRYLVAYRENAALIRVIDEVATVDREMQGVLTERSVAYVARTEAHIRAVGRLGTLPAALDPYTAAVALTSMVSRYARAVFGGSPTVIKSVEFEQSVRTLTVLWSTCLGLSVPAALLDGPAGAPAAPEEASGLALDPGID